MKKISIVFFCLVCFFTVSCASVSNVGNGVWNIESEGLSFRTFKGSSFVYHLAKIDLNENWTIVSVPEKSGWVKPVSVKTFAKKSGLAAAINTTPFIKKGLKTKLLGINVSAREKYSEVNPRYSAVAFFKDEQGGFKAEIFDSQSELEGLLPEYVFGGYFTVYRQGKVYEYKNIKNFRSALAVSNNGKTIYLMSGKKMSYGDCAVEFSKLGVDCAMEFDGGNSSQMVINGKKSVKSPFCRKVPAIFGFRMVR